MSGSDQSKRCQASLDPTLDPDAILYGDLAPRGAQARPPPVPEPERRQEKFLPKLDRFRYLQKNRGSKYCWTTEPDTATDPMGWYYSFVYKPAGPGARTGKAKQWRLSRPSIRRHRRRKDAKGRAIELYEKELNS